MGNAEWEILLKLIVPAVIVLSWVFKQAVTPEPTMPKAPAGRGPARTPRTGPPPPPARNPEPGPRVGDPSPPPPPPRPEPLTSKRLGPDQEMVIIGSETRTRRAVESARKPDLVRAGKKPRRRDETPEQGRSRSKRATIDPTSGSHSESGKLVDRPTYIGPLATMDGLDSSSISSVVTSASMTSSTSIQRASWLRDLCGQLREPSRIREMIVLSEILQPPVSRRRRGL